MTRFCFFVVILLAVICLLAPYRVAACPCVSVSADDHPAADSVRRDSLARDSLPADTMREVIVSGDTTLRVKQILDNTLKHQRQPRVMSVGDLLEKLSPGLNDKITHPFAMKQRKAERRKKKLRKVLEDYNRAKTFNELLDEAVRRQQMEDERARREAGKDD